MQAETPDRENVSLLMYVGKKTCSEKQNYFYMQHTHTHTHTNTHTHVNTYTRIRTETSAKASERKQPIRVRSEGGEFSLLFLIPRYQAEAFEE